MFYRYEIRNNGKEEILYLFLEMNYEFSKELDSKDKEIGNKIQDFIKTNDIKYNGNKIYLVADGIIIKAFELNKKIDKKRIHGTMYSNENFIINLKTNKSIIKLTLKEYLLGVLATNALENLELTTLKSLTLLYRTYAYREMKENKTVLSFNNFQMYRPISYYKLLWQDNYKETYNKLLKAINDTDGEFVTYKDEYILPYIHISNNGNTNSGDIPYLDKRLSLWDYASPYYLDIKTYSYDYLEDILKMKKEDIKKIKILETSSSKYIKRIKVGDNIYTGENFKRLLNLKSSDISMIINPQNIKFITKGYGNNLGLSQFGANEIAKVGCSYTSIIKYYFPKITIKKYI